MKGHLRSKYQHSTFLEMSYFIMTIIHWLLFSHFIIHCNEFKMFITLGFYDSKYGLYIKDWRNAKYTMHNYFTACIYCESQYKVAQATLSVRNKRLIYSVVLVRCWRKTITKRPKQFWNMIFYQIAALYFLVHVFYCRDFRYGTVVQYERMTVDMWWRNLILLVIAETI